MPALVLPDVSCIADPISRFADTRQLRGTRSPIGTVCGAISSSLRLGGLHAATDRVGTLAPRTHRSARAGETAGRPGTILATSNFPTSCVEQRPSIHGVCRQHFPHDPARTEQAEQVCGPARRSHGPRHGRRSPQFPSTLLLPFARRLSSRFSRQFVRSVPQGAGASAEATSSATRFRGGSFLYYLQVTVDH